MMRLDELLNLLIGRETFISGMRARIVELNSDMLVIDVIRERQDDLLEMVDVLSCGTIDKKFSMDIGDMIRTRFGLCIY